MMKLIFKILFFLLACSSNLSATSFNDKMTLPKVGIYDYNISNLAIAENRENATTSEIEWYNEWDRFNFVAGSIAGIGAMNVAARSARLTNVLLHEGTFTNHLMSFSLEGNGVWNKIRRLFSGVEVSGVGNLLDDVGKFIDDILEADYLAYVTRKTNAGKTPRPRLEWKEVRDYWLYDSPLARGNAFNKKAIDNDWYPYNEVHLGNGKRLDSYRPPSNGNPGEIVSRKATNLDDIQLSTFESYLDEILAKYSPGTAINSPKYSPYLDNQVLQGNMYLEIPASNQSISTIQDYVNLANSKGVNLRFKPE